jgi:uncharacterized membrane protein YgcG
MLGSPPAGTSACKETPAVKIRPLIILISLLTAALLVGCGGGDKGQSVDESTSVDQLLKQTFSGEKKVDSGRLDLTVAIDVTGGSNSQLQGPISLKLSGPFQSNGRGKLPSLNWQASFSGGGQSFSGGLISTGDNAFVSYQGSNYEVGAAQIAQINQQLASQTDQNKSLADFGIDPKNWITDAEDKGDENVNGADTTHVKAAVDVGKMLTDLNKTVQQAGGAMGSSAPSQITPQQIDQIKQVVKNPTIDVYVGKDDDTLRRLNVSIDFEIPEAQRSQFQGAQGGNVTFSLDLRDVGKPQTVQAPSNAKPLSELQAQLQGSSGGSFGGSGSGGSGSSGGSGGSGGSGSGGGGTSSSDAQKWAKCIQQANGDAAAIQKCNKILQK